MWQIIWFFLGYSRVRISGAAPQWALNRFASSRVAFREVLRQDDFTLELTIRTADDARAAAAAQKAMCELTVLHKGGFWAVFHGLFRRPVLVALLAAAVAVAVVLPKFVLFYKVEGNARIPTELILRNLQDLGVGFGTYGPDIQPQWVKNHMLTRIPELQWLTVTQNGCCATVVVRERPETEPIADRKTPRNVIASMDGLVTSVSVLEGNRLCKAGDIVQKGQLLVSAYTDLEFSIQVTSALAEIYAQTWHKQTTVLPDTDLQKAYTGKTSTRICLVLGRTRLNIFGNSGIIGSNCDKMTTYHNFTLPGGFSFPVAIEITKISEYDTQETPADEASIKACLQTNVKDQTQAQMLAGTILTEQYVLDKTDGVYRLRSVLGCEEMIARMVDAEIFKDERAQ